MTKKRAVIELLIADVFWGAAFVAAPIAQRVWESSQISFIRFFIPSIIGLLFGLAYKKWRLNKDEFRMGLVPGFFFAATIYVQTIGLETTTPSRSGFITVLYVIFVPLLELYLHKKKFHYLFIISIIGALLGMAMLLNLDWSSWNIGDSFTFACALFSTWHIYQIGKLGKRFRKPLLLNLAQSIWAALFLLPFSLMSHAPWVPEQIDLMALLSLCVITFGATMIAFSIQARVQAFLNASTSSMLFLLEAPFAMFFSWLIIHESITVLQIVGAMLILFSCSIAVKNS